MSTPPPPAATTAERRVYAPMAEREATLRPTTWNAEQRTVEVVWTTGARGVKFLWDTCGLVDEELATSPTNVRLDRLNAGAPVLNTHQRSDLAGQIGVVVPGSARMASGQGTASLQLSDRADLAPIVADIAAGVIRNLSVGYTVHAYEIEQREGQRPLYRAVDWEPFEISFVPVPFDAAAQVRSGPFPQPCILRTLSPESTIMSRSHSSSAITPPQPEQGVRVPDDSRPATIPELRELTRAMVDQYGCPAEICAELALELAERNFTDAEARTHVLQILAERQRRNTRSVSAAGTALVNSQRGGDTFDNPQFHSRVIEDALYARMSGREPSAECREFMGMSLVQLAGEISMRMGTARDPNRMAPREVLRAASWSGAGQDAFISNLATRMGGPHTTSDFPNLLATAGQRYLLDQFAAAASALRRLSRERTARDFRDINALQLSSFGTLEEVPEAGEVKHGTFADRKQAYRVRKFSKQFGLSIEAIVNDDLGAFSNPMRIMGRSAAETEAALFADLINSNPKLSDGSALFHANHGNLAVAGAAPDVETLAAGRLAMRSQKDDDGVTPLAAAPQYIVASPKRETAIEQLLVATTVPTTSAETNPFHGKLTPLIDPRLNADPWFLFADPSMAPVLEHAYLDGYQGPRVRMREGWNIIGQEFRVDLFFGCGLVDHRGAYKNPGA